MQITARFYVQEVTKRAQGYGLVVLHPAYREGQNAAWAKATPSGKIELTVDQSLPAFDEFARALDEKLDIAITFEAAAADTP
jgi:hypothetical protein